jgi:hypothetical protein
MEAFVYADCFFEAAQKRPTALLFLRRSLAVLPMY